MRYFLILLGLYLAHDAYGNRLLPPPNILAQLSGYYLALVCIVMALDKAREHD